MNVKESLLSIVSYPVPDSVILNITESRELDISTEATNEIRTSSSYRLAMADVLTWVSFAANIQEGGININMLYSDRKEMRDKANAIYIELGEKTNNLIRQTFTFLGEDI